MGSPVAMTDIVFEAVLDSALNALREHIRLWTIGRLGAGVFEDNAARRKPADKGRCFARVSVCGKVIGPKRIHENHDDVGGFGSGQRPIVQSRICSLSAFNLGSAALFSAGRSEETQRQDAASPKTCSRHGSTFARFRRGGMLA